MVVLVALFVTLIPTTIGALLSAIGIAGMDRLVRFNVLAMSGRAVEAAGDVDTLLLDKTGTITLGNRMATEFIAAARRRPSDELAEAAQLASLADETPEGRSIVVLAKEKYGLRGARDGRRCTPSSSPFTAQTRMSGVDIDGAAIRKGAVDAVVDARPAHGRAGAGRRARAASPSSIAKQRRHAAGRVARRPRCWASSTSRTSSRAASASASPSCAAMGIRTVMITGDNPLTAAAIAAEAGVDDFLAQATPEAKLELIREEQAKGKLVAMCGDGTNDAPALAQADVGVAMNTGTRPRARPATWSISTAIRPSSSRSSTIGKQLLMTRGALTTFSIANDVAKYFAIIPAMFVAVLSAARRAQRHGPGHAAERHPVGDHLQRADHRGADPAGAARRAATGRSAPPALLRRNLLVYGLGGIVVPFIGIKLIDMAVTAIGLA